jgi:allantoin racemase
MSIVIINPNSTAAMTDAMVRMASETVPERRFIGWTSDKGPPAIQGAEDGAAATPPLLELVKQADAEGADAIIIGCFDDTGLVEAAALARCPVVGIGQAAFHYAALRNWRFSVVTTLAVSVPVLEDNIAMLGLAKHLGRVRASDVPVLALEENPEAATGRILDEARRAEAQDDVQAVILGCAGMVHVTRAVEAELDVAVLDPVAVAASAMKWLT